MHLYTFYCLKKWKSVYFINQSQLDLHLMCFYKRKRSSSLKMYFFGSSLTFFFIIAMNIRSFSSPAPILHPKMNAKKYY